MNPNNSEFSLPASFFAVFLCVIFGANYVAVKVGLSGIGTFTLAALRFTIASLSIALWAKITGQSFSLKKGQIRYIIILTVIFSVQLSLFYLGMSKTNAAHATLVSNFVPFFILFLSHYFIPDDKITIRKFFGILLGFLAIILIFFGKGKGAASLKEGDLIILAVTFIWACNTVFVKKIINDFHPFQLVLYPMIFSLPFFFTEAFLLDERMFFNINPNVIGALLYQGIVTAAFGFVAWNNLLKIYGATSLHSFIFIIPISGVIIGGLLIDEPVTYNIVFALVLIASGILAVHYKPAKSTVSPFGRSM
ncbi:MAG: DMT family transporter [Proteobacteria bacterium]|nr:DMT family transporter [Pseudomonadota bacterium]